MRSHSNRRGFTVVEVLVAMLVMTIAVLAMASSSGLTAKMMRRGHNAEMASAFAMQRMEELRMTGCKTRTNAKDTLWRGGTDPAAINSWVWSNGTRPSTYRITMTTTYRSGAAVGTNISESSLLCVF
jgi:prepilin-type N-terminal cleavage/methylation domain-containing protein